MPGRWHVDSPSADDIYDDCSTPTAGLDRKSRKPRGESFVFVDDDSDNELVDGQLSIDVATYSEPFAVTATTPTTAPPAPCWSEIPPRDMWPGNESGFTGYKPLPLREISPSLKAPDWPWTDEELWIEDIQHEPFTCKKRRKTFDHPQLESLEHTSTLDCGQYDLNTEQPQTWMDQIKQLDIDMAFVGPANIESTDSLWAPTQDISQRSDGPAQKDAGYEYVSLSEALLKRPGASAMTMSKSGCRTGIDLSNDFAQSIDLDTVQDLPSSSPEPLVLSAHIPTSSGCPSHLQHRPRKRRSSDTTNCATSPSAISTFTSYSSTYAFPLSRQTSPFTHPRTGLSLVMGYNTSLPKSRLDMYITAMRQMSLAAKSSGIGPLKTETQRALTAEGVLWSVREAWPSAEGYWNLTATFHGFLAAELWRNFPSERTYRSLPAAYRPTRAQLAIPHSPMIDWLPWPDVRDLAIKHQDHLDLDALFRAAIHNVVAHRKRRVGAPPSPTTSASGVQDDNTSFRIWDLVQLERLNGTEPLAEPTLAKRPVPRSPGVKAVLRAYDLEYDEFDTQKLDDGFWEAFPALYADTAASAWRVRGFEGLGMVDVGRPVELKGEMVRRLRGRVEGVVGGRVVV